MGELGYANPTGMLSVATNRMDELAPCLEKLVPVIQQSMVDYITDGTEVLELLHEFNEKGYATSWWKTPMADLEYAWKVMGERIVHNGTNDTVADFDMERVARMYEIVKPWLDERAAEDVSPEMVVTNRFIDPSIGFK